VSLGLAAALLFVFSPASADEIVLANGDKINGEIVEWSVDTVVIEHPQLGTMRLALDDLKIDTGKPPKKGWFDTNFMRGWNRNINMGLNGTIGDNNATNLTIGYNFNYADDFKRWRFTGRYFYNKSDDGDGDNNARIDLRRDWLVPLSRWFGYAAFRYQFDQFESWQHRTTLSGGPGLHLLQTERHLLDTTVGLAFTREFGDRQTQTGEGVWGVEYAWQISERQKFTFSNDFFPEFTPNAGEFRNFTVSEYSIVLSNEPVLKWTLGIQNDYETDIEPGDKENDFRYYMALGVDW
jgi:putative salt-induced outer membrane protein YdiY